MGLKELAFRVTENVFFLSGEGCQEVANWPARMRRTDSMSDILIKPKLSSVSCKHSLPAIEECTLHSSCD